MEVGRAIELESGGGTVTYKECQKNHTISMGSYIKDGCVAFMPNHAKQNGLFCHACGCHRNFHRQEVLKVTSDDVLDASPVTVHGKIHGVSSISNSHNRGFIQNNTIVDLKDDDKFFVVLSDDEVEPDMKSEIEETVISILKQADMNEMTGFKVRKLAGEKLGFDLSSNPQHKKFVRTVIKSFLLFQQPESETTKQVEIKPSVAGKEYDDDDGS